MRAINTRLRRLEEKFSRFECSILARLPIAATKAVAVTGPIPGGHGPLARFVLFWARDPSPLSSPRGVAPLLFECPFDALARLQY